MNGLRKYTPFFASALLMYVVIFIIYPHYQYYIDPDGTAYLTVSKRYATGDIAKAINGYWSPWSCWLTALLTKAGWEVLTASWLVNTAGATGFLFISHALFLRFGISNRMQWWLNITLALFLCYAVFAQSFDDLWECFFLLLVLRILLSDRFVNRPLLWVAMGITGTLAYFAKAYSFPFFILNTVCCVYVLAGGDRKKWLYISSVSIGVMLLCALPWLLLLHDKYHIWTTSTAGPLNVSWYLVGHPVYKDGIHLLLPPAYSDSPTFWEDAWLANGATPHFWDSMQLFGGLIIRTGYHVLLFLLSSLQLSVFLPLLFIVAVLTFLLKKKNPVFINHEKLIALSFILFPLGYFFINFESRYIWYMLPLSMILGVIYYQGSNAYIRIPARLFVVLFPLSYLVVPVWSMIKIYDSGKEEFKLARQLTAAGIKGSYTANIHSRSMSRLAYFSGSQYYFVIGAGGRYSSAGIFEEMRQYHIQYYIHHNASGQDSGGDFARLFNDDDMIREHQSQLTAVDIPGAEHVTVYRVDYNK